MRSERLMLEAYFQRNLVWRVAHKKDFIETILKGYPFPQIFLARGPIDLESMESRQCVVDGQQRLNTIKEFLEGKLIVDGQTFSDLEAKQKEDFLKYEVAVIDFDLDAGDLRLKEVFHRLNRTFYSLSSIEKIASEYSASEFLLVARLLNGDFGGTVNSLAETEDEGSFDEDSFNPFGKDPGITEESWRWLQEQRGGDFSTMIRSVGTFSAFEFDRKVPLMFCLNVMCTYLYGYYNRNDKVRQYLDQRNDSFPERDDVMLELNRAATFLLELNLEPESFWLTKANLFSLLCELSRSKSYYEVGVEEIRRRLLALAKDIPVDYALAAREGVGRKAQRELRARVLRDSLLS
jgi:hypothetical protein